MAATEKRKKTLEYLLQRINARRRMPEGTIPVEAAPPAGLPATLALPEEEIPFIPEEFEVKPGAGEAEAMEAKEEAPPEAPAFALEEPFKEAPTLPRAAPEEEKIEEEVTDRVQVIPPIAPEKEEITWKWFGERVPAREEVPKKETEAEPEIKIQVVESLDFPEVESSEEIIEVEKEALPVEEPAAPEPAIISVPPPIKEARPFGIEGTPEVKRPLNIGEILRRAFAVGKDRD